MPLKITNLIQNLPNTTTVISISGHSYHEKRQIKTSRCFLVRRKSSKYFQMQRTAKNLRITKEGHNSVKIFL